MHSNVLEYEPEKAIFVYDDSPLIFYEKIAHWASFHLKHNGKIYFEINSSLSEETMNLLEKRNFSIKIKKDLQRVPRILKATKSLCLSNYIQDHIHYYNCNSLLNK